MRKLLLITVVSLIVFNVLAIGQEWEFFASAWFGAVEEEPVLEESERKEAADTVYLLLSLMQHYYSSGGDPRYADRMPASPAVLDEAREDVEYLARNRRLQDPSLDRLEVAAVEALGTGRVEVRTREWWRVVIHAQGSPSDGPPEIQTLFAKYLLSKQDGAWRVETWDLVEPETLQDGASSETEAREAREAGS